MDLVKHKLLTHATLPCNPFSQVLSVSKMEAATAYSKLGNMLVRPKARSSKIPSTTWAVAKAKTKEAQQLAVSSPRPCGLASWQVHFKSQCTIMFTAMEDLIHRYLDILPLRVAIDPKYVLSGNFAPVDELAPQECKVAEGSLPQFLNGAYIRNGPNPQFPPRGPHHLVEGDGMLHLIRITDGKAKFCSRYVQTYKYRVEKAMGARVLPNIYSGFNGILAIAGRRIVMAGRILSGHYHHEVPQAFGVANTSVAYLFGTLYALEESDLPYAISVTSEGNIKTLGRSDFHGKLMKCMTAHPKVDPDTGEVFAIRYSLARPFLTYFRFDPCGNKQPDIHISSIDKGSIFHDCAITKKYVIFSNTQLAVSPLNNILAGGPPMGADPTKVPRLGVLPRYAMDESEMIWFDSPGVNLFHFINAWDEDDTDEVVIIAPNVQAIEHAMERMDLVHFSLEKITINLRNGKIRRQPFSSKSLELAVISPSYIGKKNKYVYASIYRVDAGEPVPKVTGIMKLDVSGSQPFDQKSVVGMRMFKEGCFGGEPFFVAKDPDDPGADEDDGCLVCYTHDEMTGQSEFVVMDAKSQNLDFLATVRLPQRVPYGFHGLFVSEKDLNQQIFS